MKTKQVIIGNIEKKYKNPIPELIQTTCSFASTVYISNEKKRLNAKSIMGMMAFNPAEGMSITIETDGTDEDAAIGAVESFFVCR